MKLFKEINTNTPGDPPVSHDKMIEIFTETLDQLGLKTGSENFRAIREESTMSGSAELIPFHLSSI